jgi:hypothetical protein
MRKAKLRRRPGSGVMLRDVFQPATPPARQELAAVVVLDRGVVVITDEGHDDPPGDGVGRLLK